MSKHILFISTNNLSTNPRMLKEIKLALLNGFEVSFIAFNLGNWSDETDLEYLKELVGVKAYYLSAKKKPLAPWFFSSFVWKSSIYLSKFFKSNLKFHAYAHNKRTWPIVKFLRNNAIKCDMVIAHNLGALYPSYKYSISRQIPFAFDMEDYHPGESCTVQESLRREFLLKGMLSNAKYLSFASPLIEKQSIMLLGQTIKPSCILINNCFPSSEFKFIEQESSKVKFVWFSQNIAPNRGLELLLPALAKFKDKIQVQLIGKLYHEFYENFLAAYSDFIQIEKPMSSTKLSQHVCSFDIGLAIEISASDLNKDIALSNKIFTYAQAGLYLLTTNTSAQKRFLNENPQLGILTEQSSNKIENPLLYIIENIENIRAHKEKRFEYAKKLAWENEIPKLMEQWKPI
jgi:glycosyltransferase involved in cell wall biosynthesis